MLPCRLCRYRFIHTLISVHLSSLHRRSYAVAAARTVHSPRSPWALRQGSKTPPPAQYRGKGRDASGDPAKLADNVRQKLQRGEWDGALILTKGASRTMNSVVSWNQIINHHMDNAEIKRAFRTFNEMKKRGISPDSHTFTIMLNGLSNYPHFGQSLPRALQLYNSLSASKSPVAPNVFHTNAILKVCVRAGDLDSVWNIIGTLPPKGPNAPNTLTYTIFLNGIGSTQDDTVGVEDARRVWAGVLSRWNRGHLRIDEALTCAMGRVLLAGSRESDWKEVFMLCEQIFGISSLVAREPSKPVTEDSIFVEGTNNQISSILSPPEALNSPDMVPPPAAPKATTPNSPTVAPMPLGPLFTPVVTPHPSSTRPAPGNSTLSLLMKACSLLRDESLSFKYWEKLTNKPYCITPDLENYHDKLRILRRSRLGTEALKVVEAMRVPPTTKTFFIAMSSCKRRGRSNAFCAAERLLELMKQKYGLLVDVKLWNMFLQCALKTGEPSYIKKALRRIDEEMDMEVELVRRKTKPIFMERALELVRSMVGAVEVLTLGERISVTWGHGERAALEKRRKELGAMVTRYGAGVKRRTYNIEMEGEDEE